MIYTTLTNKALRLAYAAHHGQTDKSGQPYIFHPYHLAKQMTDEVSVCVALLHDVVEDTDLTFADLEREFPPEVTGALRLLTHEKGTDYFDYVRALRGNPVAVKVKLADLAHNSDEARFAGAYRKSFAGRGGYKKIRLPFGSLILYVREQSHHSVPPCVIDADEDDDHHQADKEPINHCVIHPFIELAAHDAPSDAAQGHQHQHGHLKGRHGGGEKGGEQVRDLAEKDDIQGIGSGLFRLHAEEEVQHHQIERPAADTKEAGKGAQSKTDQAAGEETLHILGVDSALFQGVEQRAQHQHHQAQGLRRAGDALPGSHGAQQGESLIAQDSADGGTDGKGRAGVQVDGTGGTFVRETLADIVEGHAQHRAA